MEDKSMLALRMLAVFCLGLIVAATDPLPMSATELCEDIDVSGPFGASGENAEACRNNLLAQVDCDLLCGFRECPGQNPILENKCRNVTTVVTKFEWAPRTQSCTVDEISCVCRCADPLPGRVGRGECGDGVVDRGEECDPGIATSPSAGGIPIPDECPIGSVCSEDCTCGEPPVCGNGVVEGDEECDPPGATGQCSDGADCGEGCRCGAAPTPTATATPTPTASATPPVTDPCVGSSSCGGTCLIGSTIGLCILDPFCRCCPTDRVCSTISGPTCCEPEEFCNGLLGCAPCRELGEPCADDRECCTGFICFEGSCD